LWRWWVKYLGGGALQLGHALWVGDGEAGGDEVEYSLLLWCEARSM
jgi:hypothetical protein